MIVASISVAVSKYSDFFVLDVGCPVDFSFSTFRLPLAMVAVFDFCFKSAFGNNVDDSPSTKKFGSIFLPLSSNNIPSSSSVHFFLRTSGVSSPHALQNPPIDLSLATTLCQGKVSEGPGLRPMAFPTALADVPSSLAILPYERTVPLSIVPTTSYTRR